MPSILQLYTAGSCIVSFLVKLYHRKISDGALCRYHDQTVKAICHHVNSCPTKTQKVADELTHDGLGHCSISCPVWMCALCGKSCRKSCQKYKRSLHVNFYTVLVRQNMVTILNFNQFWQV